MAPKMECSTVALYGGQVKRWGVDVALHIDQVLPAWRIKS